MPIAVPVLTVVDSEDGTGATATVASSTAGSTNTVSVTKWKGADQESSWVSGGSRVGDGTVALALTKGFYWAKCESVSGAESVTSNLVSFGVTDGADALHQQCIDATVAKLQTMVFRDNRLAAGRLSPTNDIHVQPALDLVNLKFPCIVVHLSRLSATVELGGTNIEDDITYPVWVMVIDREVRQTLEAMPKYLLWREQIARAFRNQRLPGLSEVIYRCNVTDDHLPTQDVVIWQHIDTALLLNFVSREPRGLGA